MPRYLKTKQDGAATNVPSVDVATIVKGVVENIREHGDAAVLQYSQQFDSWARPSFCLRKDEIESAIAACPE
jgi:histidinol dehydrogenase